MKILLLGDGGVGKTSLAECLMYGNKKMRKYKPTLGFNIYPLQFSSNNIDVDYDIWDISGQEKFGEHIHRYVKKADHAFICYDNSKISKKNAENVWAKLVPEGCSITFIRLKGDIGAQDPEGEHRISVKEDPNEDIFQFIHQYIVYGLSQIFRLSRL
jgi:small GTP-binding protein